MKQDLWHSLVQKAILGFVVHTHAHTYTQRDRKQDTHTHREREREREREKRETYTHAHENITQVQQLRSSLIELGVKEGELPQKKDGLWEMWTEKKKNTTPLTLYVVLGIFSSKGYIHGFWVGKPNLSLPSSHLTAKVVILLRPH